MPFGLTACSCAALTPPSRSALLPVRLRSPRHSARVPPRQLLKELEQRGKDFSALQAQLSALRSGGKGGGGGGADGEAGGEDVYEEDERNEELEEMHRQLTALLASSEAGGSFSAAQAAAELAGVPAAGGAGLHAQQAALAEARCRERFERRALEEFIRHSLHDLPTPPAKPSAAVTVAEGEGEGEGGSEDAASVISPRAWLDNWSVGVDGGLAELQARVGMLSNAHRSHAQSWTAMEAATAERVESLSSLKAQLGAAPEADGSSNEPSPREEGAGVAAVAVAGGESVVPRLTLSISTGSPDGGDTPMGTPRDVVTPRGGLRRQPSNALIRQHSTVLVETELSREAAVLAALPAEHAALMGSIARSLTRLLTSVVATADAFGRDATAREAVEATAAAPLEALRVALSAADEASAGEAAADEAAADEAAVAPVKQAAKPKASKKGGAAAVASKMAAAGLLVSPVASPRGGASTARELSELIASVEAVLACLLSVRASYEKRREEVMRQKAASLATAKKELESLQPQREAALKRAEAQHDAERASLRAELTAATAREEASDAALRELQTELVTLKRAKAEAGAAAEASAASLQRELGESHAACKEARQSADTMRRERDESLSRTAASEAAVAAYEARINSQESETSRVSAWRPPPLVLAWPPPLFILGWLPPPLLILTWSEPPAPPLGIALILARPPFLLLPRPGERGGRLLRGGGRRQGRRGAVRAAAHDGGPRAGAARGGGAAAASDGGAVGSGRGRAAGQV